MEIHVDCDNGWVYSNDLEIPEMANLSIYSEAIPSFIELLKKYKVTGIFFVVGRDLLEDKFAKHALVSAVRNGNLIGNHTHGHKSQYSKMKNQEKFEEVENCHQAILNTLGVEAVHFRAPGYSFNNKIAEKIYLQNYKYEGSYYKGIYLQLLNITFRLLKSSKVIKTEKPKKIDQKIKIQKIQTFSMFQLPIHSSFMVLYPKWLRDIIIKRMKTSADYYLFHAIDLVPNLHPNTKIPISGLNFEERMKLAESIIARIASKK